MKEKFFKLYGTYVRLENRAAIIGFGLTVVLFLFGFLVYYLLNESESYTFKNYGGLFMPISFIFLLVYIVVAALLTRLYCVDYWILDFNREEMRFRFRNRTYKIEVNSVSKVTFTIRKGSYTIAIFSPRRSLGMTFGGYRDRKCGMGRSAFRQDQNEVLDEYTTELDTYLIEYGFEKTEKTIKYTNNEMTVVAYTRKNYALSLNDVAIKK